MATIASADVLPLKTLFSYRQYVSHLFGNDYLAHAMWRRFDDEPSAYKWIRRLCVSHDPGLWVREQTQPTCTNQKGEEHTHSISGFGSPSNWVG